jgi:hypothetical protein
VEHRPQVPRVVAHSGQPLDQLRDTRQGPQLAGEPVRAGALQQACSTRWRSVSESRGFTPLGPGTGAGSWGIGLSDRSRHAQALLQVDSGHVFATITLS